MTQSKKIRRFQRKVFSYYKKNKRDLLFRKTTDPYAILLSEIMLQQTQVERGIRYYSKWLKKWPTIHDLAKAPRVDVLKEWMGLGYNNRAKNLHESAKMISGKFGGDVLLAMPHYEELPGIGPYTAAAVQIFSANKDIVTVDTNIRRILIHEFKLSEKISDKELWNIAEECLPKGRSRDWHNALMDYGATMLTSRKTGIRPKTRQSKFEGSDRQMRSAIVRLMVQHPKKSFSEKEIAKQLDESVLKIKVIASDLVQEKLLEKKKGRFCISAG